MEKARRQPGIYDTIYRAVRQIPRGKVATYGEVARISGMREHARVVGYALHNLKPNSGVPWHRVVNSKGMISLRKHTDGHERQRRLLELEGVEFSGDRIDLLRYGVRESAGNRKVARTRRSKSNNSRPKKNADQ